MVALHSPSSPSPSLSPSPASTSPLLTRLVLGVLFLISLAAWLPWARVNAPVPSVAALQDAWYWSAAELHAAMHAASPAAAAPWPVSRLLASCAVALSASLLLCSLSQTRLRRSYGLPVVVHATARSPLRLMLLGAVRLMLALIEHSAFADVAAAAAAGSQPAYAPLMPLLTLLKTAAATVQLALLAVLVLRAVLLSLQRTFPASPLLSPKRAPRTPPPPISDIEEVTSPVRSILRSAKSARKTQSKTVTFRKAVNRKNIPAYEPDSRNTVPRRVLHFDDVDDDDDLDGF